MLEGIVRTRVAADPASAQVEVASRTDRGVHARANALGITSHLGARPLLKSLNEISPSIFFTAAREVPRGFSVRTARCRRYRYFEPSEGTHIDRWRAAAALFRGYVDVRSFAAEVRAEAPVWRTIDRVAVRPRRGHLEVDLQAPSFAWKEVRKIIAALRAVDSGRLPMAQLREAIEGRRRLALPAAEPERLVLWEVAYDGPWELQLTGSQDRRTGKLAARTRQDAQVRATILKALGPEPPARNGPG